MRLALSATLLLACVSVTPAEEPEPIPAPKIVVPSGGGNLFLPPPSGGLLLPPPPPITYQHGTKDVWRNFAVDDSGRWRPRVILAPYGNNYYHMTGQYYPWATTNPRFLRPFVLD